MTHIEQHVWNCDLCGEELIEKKDDTIHYQPGIESNRLPKGWGNVEITPQQNGGYLHAHACPSCLEDVHTCVKELKRG